MFTNALHSTEFELVKMAPKAVALLCFEYILQVKSEIKYLPSMFMLPNAFRLSIT